MAKKSKVTFNIEKLQVLQTSLKKMADEKYKIQVGIFGNKNARPEDEKTSGPTNAEIGYKNEMGVVSEHIPRRSFLWDTFTKHFKALEMEIKEAKLVEKYLQVGKLDDYLKKVSFACTNLVQDAIETSGFGAWPPLAAYTIKMRHDRGLKQGGEKPLWDTGQLMRSISARVVKT